MKIRLLNTFKEKKKAKNFQNVGIIITMENSRKNNFGEHKQVYIKDGGNNCKYVWLQNNKVNLINVKIHFWTFLGLF